VREHSFRFRQTVNFRSGFDHFGWRQNIQIFVGAGNR
jgi:hypothetical protein